MYIYRIVIVYISAQSNIASNEQHGYHLFPKAEKQIAEKVKMCNRISKRKASSGGSDKESERVHPGSNIYKLNIANKNVLTL